MDIENVIRGLDELFAERKSDQVEDYLSKHLEEALKEGDVGAAITIINELIGFYRDSSQYDKAEADCEKLLPFMERAGLKDTIHYGTSCLNIANAYRAAGKWKLSLQYYEQVEQIYQKVLEAKDFRWASYRNNLSLLYQEMGRFEDACQALSDALVIVKEYLYESGGILYKSWKASGGRRSHTAGTCNIPGWIHRGLSLQCSIVSTW